MTEVLPVRLSEEELKAAAEDLAVKVKERSKLEAEKKEFNEHMKGQLKEIEEAIQARAQMVREKMELRPVEIEEHFEETTFTVGYYRVDTGTQVRMRPMDPMERERARQGKLFAMPIPAEAATDTGRAG